MATQSQDIESNRLVNQSRQSDRTSTVMDRVKRGISAILGSALLVHGLRRRSLRGIMIAIVGGWLLARTLGSTTPSDQSRYSRSVTERTENQRTEVADATEVSSSITIGKPADELYEAWRDPDQFSRIMGHFADVTQLGENSDRYRWTVHGPFNRDLSWETYVVEDRPGEHLRWKAATGTTVPNEGSVRFRPAPGDRGTITVFEIRFDPPGGALGDAVMEYLGIVPSTITREALRRFKRLVETGEIPTLAGNPSARGKGDLL